jgi:hypothetical protein
MAVKSVCSLTRKNLHVKVMTVCSTLLTACSGADFIRDLRLGNILTCGKPESENNNND